jgi:hypothetical protein
VECTLMERTSQNFCFFSLSQTEVFLVATVVTSAYF